MYILPFIYLSYMFISLYFLMLYFLIYRRHRKEIFQSPKLAKIYSVSVVIPAYNEEDCIEGTVHAVMKSTYPLQEVIVVNDGSKDRTAEIVRELMKRYKNLKLLDKKNSGKADSINQALKIAKGELFAVVDSDSYPAEEAIEKLVAYFSDEKVGAATCPILARNKNRFFERLQAIEYSAIAITRKLLEYIGAIYVTPGPLALYRKSALIKIGGFDSKNMTEDIEVTWHLTYAGYDRKMCLNTRVTTIVPDKFKTWFRQRRRWSMGGMQTIGKYRGSFLKRGMLGFFILPFFILSTFLGLLGLSIFAYLVIRNFISTYLFTKYSFAAGTAVLTLNELYITPTVLNYLGFALFFFGSIFTLLALYLMGENISKKENVFNVMFYLIIYLTVYPFIMISAIYSLIRRDLRW